MKSCDVFYIIQTYLGVVLAQTTFLLGRKVFFLMLTFSETGTLPLHKYKRCL